MEKSINLQSARNAARRAMCVLLALLMVFGLLGALAPAARAEGKLVTETPILVVTGAAVIGNGGKYAADNVSRETAYTLAELKAMAAQSNTYSAINTYLTKKFYRATGVAVAGLLAGTAFNAASDKLCAIASDGFLASFDPAAKYVNGASASTGFGTARYYYPDFMSGSNAGAVKVDTILAWATANSTTAVPASAKDADYLVMVAGQLAPDDQNNPLFNKGVTTLRGGDNLSEVVLTVCGKAYTRAELLLMDRAEYTYSYITKKGSMTDKVRGVPLSVLLKDVDQAAKITFSTADNYNVAASGMTVAELIEGDFMIAYEKYDSASGKWTGLYRGGDDGIYGLMYLYGETGLSPAAMVTGIATVASKYKHADAGVPYNIDSLTGATLTVEGPGVTATTPIRVSDLESTSNANIASGSYKNGSGKEFTYEGVDVLSIIDGAVNTSVEKEDESIVVVFKNRLRQDIATIAYGDIKAASAAGAPVLLAYGVGNGTNTAPFVFDNSAGFISALDNDDGPVRLVFDTAKFTSSATSAAVPSVFQSCAYLYVERGAGVPGYKHSGAADDAYDNPENTEYFITLTGSALGREVNYTVAELEAMVAYNKDGMPDASGLGYRASYGLSNTTYWYVNEYEGIDLWKLLTQKLGVSASKYQNDKNTLVSFASWDNYKTTAQFSMYQLANPGEFRFYEKSPLDIGTDRPTKQQLATAEYQPTIATTDTRSWTKDANGYPVLTGFPVLLAYGVNGYPYVLNNKLDGYSGGLGNDGGPLKVIFGKADGMNRSNASALENYAYFYNNGSNQLQRAQEIYVGDDTRYSTHLENPAYTAMAGSDDYKLSVEVKTETGTTTYTYTLAELESILYGSDVTKTNVDTQGRREKGYYAYKYYEESLIQDLYEGVNLWYLISEDIGLSSYIGTVSLFSKDSDIADAMYTLDEIQEDGYNSVRGTSGLGMMVAFAKNGYPLVTGSGDTGYVKSDSVTGLTIKNNGGPLMFVRAQTAAEKAAGAVTTDGDSACTVANLTKIVINLEPDDYAHDESNGANAKIKFTGSVSAGGDVTVGTIETKQKYLVTADYTIGGVGSEYRGISLYNLLNDPIIGASALTESVTVKNAAGKSVKLTVADLTDKDKNIILAYGVTGAGGEGAPLTTTNGGYMRLVINGGSAADCITNVTEIEITAAKINGWFHNFGNYAQYKDYTLEISGDGISVAKTYTVAELEAMNALIVRDSYQMGGAFYIEGIDLYKLLSGIGFAGGGTSAAITVYASDNYAISFDATQLSKGVNGKPILVAYGQGTTSTNGLPLVVKDTDAGYDANIGNAYGPLRLVVNDNTGWCNKYINKIVVGNVTTGGPSTEEPVAEKGFEVYQIGKELPYAGVRNIAEDKGGFWAGSKGAGLSYVSADGDVTVYTTKSNPALKTDYATAVAVDANGGVWFSQNANYGSEGVSPNDTLNFGVGYMKDGKITWYNKSGGQLPNDYVQAIEIAADGSVWFGSFGGLTKFDGSKWTTWTTTDGLPSTSVNVIEFDGAGGIWIGCYPDGGGMAADDLFTGGFAHMDNSGKIDYVKSLTGEFDATLGYSLLANVWVRSISVDNAGNAWIVCSGSYSSLNNVGGTVYCATASAGAYTLDTYTGDQILGSKLKGNSEIRALEADPVTGLWIGASGSGLFYGTIDGGFTAYSGDTGTWDKENTLLDNIYTITFDGTDIYVGSEGGAAVMKGAADFSDVNADYWAADNIYELAFAGIVNGTGGRTYTPGGAVTRAQFVTMLARATGDFDASTVKSAGFSDVVAGSWYEAAVNWAYGLGIVMGVGGDRFDPNSQITRQDMVSMLYRYITCFELNIEEEKLNPSFTDASNIAPYATDAVNALFRYGIVRGITDTVFGPTQIATRAQAAAIISRLLNLK